VATKEFESLLNYQTVTMFARNSDDIREYNTLQEENKRRYIKMTWTSSLLRFAQGNIKRMGQCVGLCTACYATVHGNPRLSSGDIVAIQMYIQNLFSPFMNMEFMYKRVIGAFTNLEKAVVIFARQPQIVDSNDANEWNPGPVASHASQSEIEFRNVSFRYLAATTGSSAGVSNISFRVAPGKVVAIVGASGSGKSTLVRLALRLYDVDEGAVFVDRQDIKTLTQESLRRNIGIVAQDTVLFNNTLRYNIVYGKPSATDAEVWAAARTAALGDMIDRLPDKLETKVGELGLKLSGGERQRVGIARCVIKNPAVLLFDEATSALDSKTERDIQANLSEVCHNRTTLVIAHRLSTIAAADEILVLDQGVIRERGTHRELLARGGQYADMWRLNQGGEDKVR
jgi:ATP-binding cassette, subfamily B, heavy metal transporter